jgi:REP element-mobilizing transposase RayT
MCASERQFNASVSLIVYHFIWTTRRRRRVLVGAVAARLEALLTGQAAVEGCGVIALDVRPDHVYLCVDAPPTLSADQIMFRLRGYTARATRGVSRPAHVAEYVDAELLCVDGAGRVARDRRALYRGADAALAASAMARESMGDG